MPPNKQSFRQPSGEASVKFRRACNQCNAAKVRCSGERNGCVRCLGAGTACVYGESRVGKVPGARAKKNKTKETQITQSSTSVGSGRHSPMSLSHEDDQRTWHSNDVDSALTWNSDIGQPVNTDLFGLREGNVLNNSQDSGIEGPVFNPAFADTETLDNNFFALVGSLSQTPRLATNENITSEEVTDQDAMSTTQGDISTGTIQFSPPPLPSVPLSHAEQSTAQKRGSNTVLACCDMISQLERYLLADLKPLDIILETYRRTILQLEEIVYELKEDFVPRVALMLDIIMSQIIELIRGGCDELLQDRVVPEQRNAIGSLRRQGSSLSLGFGALQPDFNEQRSWRAQVVIKELQRGSRVLDQVRNLRPTSERLSEERQAVSVTVPSDSGKKLENLISKLQSLRHSNST